MTIVRIQCANGQSVNSAGAAGDDPAIRYRSKVPEGGAPAPPRAPCALTGFCFLSSGNDVCRDTCFQGQRTCPRLDVIYPETFCMYLLHFVDTNSMN